MAIYDHEDYWNPLLWDVQRARGSVKTHVPYLTQKGLNRWRPLIVALMERGVTVCVVLQRPHNWSKFTRGMLTGPQTDDLQLFKVLVESLEKIGVHVELRDKIHAKLLIIDEHILWEGSLNF